MRNVVEMLKCTQDFIVSFYDSTINLEYNHKNLNIMTVLYKMGSENF